MGTDAEAVIERNDGRGWTCHSSLPWLGRDSWMWAAIAGACDRDGIEPPIPARGLPEDATTESRDGCGDSGFAATWLTAKELRAAIDHYHRALKHEDPVPPHEMDAICATLVEIEAAGSQARAVFWFDN
jgi:hypothetical protein